MANDIFQLTMLGVAGTEFWESVLNFQSPLTASTAPMQDAEDCITAWQNAAEGNFLDCIPQNVGITGYKCKRINNGGGPTIMKPSSAVFGNRPFDMIVSCIGPCLVSFFPHGPKFKTGRWFIPGYAAGDMLDNEPAGALVTLLTTLRTQMMAPQVGTLHNFQYVIYSRKYSIPFTPIAIELSLKVGVQNRRLKPVM